MAHNKTLSTTCWHYFSAATIVRASLLTWLLKSSVVNIKVLSLVHNSMYGPSNPWKHFKRCSSFKSSEYSKNLSHGKDSAFDESSDPLSRKLRNAEPKFIIANK